MIGAELDMAIATQKHREDLRRAAMVWQRPRACPRLRPLRLRCGRITVEIHLSPDLAPEQIDLIFASLARHLT